MEINYTHSVKLRVRYSETDQMGYCYYGNYAQYFEVGRVEAMRSFGMSYKQMEDEGIMLPVIDFQVKYFQPALYDEELTVTTVIHSLKGVRIWFEYEIRNEKNILVSQASTTLVFVAKSTMKPVQPPENFITLLQHKKASYE